MPIVDTLAGKAQSIRDKTNKGSCARRENSISERIVVMVPLSDMMARGSDRLNRLRNLSHSAGSRWRQAPRFPAEGLFFSPGRRHDRYPWLLACIIRPRTMETMIFNMRTSFIASSRADVHYITPERLPTIGVCDTCIAVAFRDIS